MRVVRSALGRPIDAHISSNRFVVVATFAAGAVGSVTELVRDGFDIVSILGAGFTAGGAVFLSWAIARELDPDHNLTAYLSSPIGLAIWFFDPAGLLISGAVLLAARIVANTTGGRLIPADLAAVVVFASITGLRPGGVIAASALGVAVIADCLLSRHGSPRQYGAGLAAVVGGAVTAVMWADGLEFTSFTTGSVILLAASIAAGTLAPNGVVTSTGDITGLPLVPARIRWGRLLTVAVVAGYAALGGSAGIVTVGPAAAALVGVPLAWAARRLAG